MHFHAWLDLSIASLICPLLSIHIGHRSESKLSASMYFLQLWFSNVFSDADFRPLEKRLFAPGAAGAICEAVLLAPVPKMGTSNLDNTLEKGAHSWIEKESTSMFASDLVRVSSSYSLFNFVYAQLYLRIINLRSPLEELPK